MASAQEYRQQLSELGLDDMEIRVSNAVEAKDTLVKIQQLQKDLRQIKRNINLDVKLINAAYREKSAGAAANTSAVLSIFGKRKMAGQLRANEKRRLANERGSIIGQYEGVKLSIDDLLVQMDGIKVELQSYIQEAKEEAMSPKQTATEKKTQLPPDIQLRFCPQCGSQVSPQDKFCRECGRQL
ncbi:MAG: zinc ribbon domain-containing protein [Caldilineales bacterium]|nr:zinc ribbon domain-containing protein [Caldilineales bacterium]